MGGALKASVHWAEWQGTGPGIGPRRKGRILRGCAGPECYRPAELTSDVWSRGQSVRAARILPRCDDFGQSFLGSLSTSQGC